MSGFLLHGYNHANHCLIQHAFVNSWEVEMSFVAEYVSFLLRAAIVVAVVFLYLLPSVSRRWTKGKWNVSQFFLNLLLGWTIFGWWLSWEQRKPGGMMGSRPWHPYRTAFIRSALTILLTVMGFLGWVLLTERPSNGKLQIITIPPKVASASAPLHPGNG